MKNPAERVHIKTKRIAAIMRKSIAEPHSFVLIGEPDKRITPFPVSSFFPQHTKGHSPSSAPAASGGNMYCSSNASCITLQRRFSSENKDPGRTPDCFTARDAPVINFFRPHTTENFIHSHRNSLLYGKNITAT
jgi:hypothetical protein